jgi:cyanophycinase
MFVNVYGAASATYIPVTETSNNADDPSVAELARQQTGFFFGGGDQLRILTALRPNGRDTLVLTAVKDMLKAGAVVGGTSAGTACQVFDFNVLTPTILHLENEICITEF